MNSSDWSIFVHVHDKILSVSCGDGTQRIKWLGHVGVAQWDDENYQGWKRLGVPTGEDLTDDHMFLN